MPPKARVAVASMALLAAVGWAWLAIARFETFHNETFDLAFYTRIAWGLVRGDGWEPIVGANVLGLHLSAILVPLGALGAVGSTAHVLLVAQSLALGAAAWPLARLGCRRLGPWGGLVGAAVFLLHPNLGHVATFEFHPGTVAVLPLAWAAGSLDRRSGRAFVWSVIGVLACREDLALVTGLMGLEWARRGGADRRVGVHVALASGAYLLLFVLVLHPLFAPAQGSLEAHFGRWGDGTGAVLWTWLTRPHEVFAHLATPDRALYLPTMLLPLLLLPVLAPRWIVLAGPILAITLMSAFPGTTDLDSHYFTPALPLLVTGAIEGAGRLARWAGNAQRRARPLVLAAAVVAAGMAHAWSGATPGAGGFQAAAFAPDARTEASEQLLAHVSPDASVQAPDALLAHLAERRQLHRAPPPERGTDFVVLDVSHRARFEGDESVLRTVEEPVVRTWIAKGDHGVRAAAGPWILLERGLEPRRGVGARAIVGRADPADGWSIAGCLAVLGARARGDQVVFELVARERCPSDLAIRYGYRPTPGWAGLLFGGLLSPSHLRTGDRLVSVHPLPGASRATAVWIGARRSSGARPEPADPHAVQVLLAAGAGDQPLPTGASAPGSSLVSAP